MSKLKEKGITLVALVVTIIILLILTGVTISQIGGNNGLFSRVKRAVEKYKEAAENETDMITELENYIDNNKIKEKTYTIIYDTNEGQGNIETQTKVEGQILKITEKKPTREGYTFLGWATTKEKADAETVEYTSGANYNKDEDITLYAVWTKILKNDIGKFVDYNVDLNGDGNTKNDWRLFYQGQEDDGTAKGRIFIIASDFVKGNLIKSGLGLTGSTTYARYWNSVPSQIQTMEKNDLLMTNMYPLTKNTVNVKCVSVMLNINNWDNFKDKEGFAEFAIGGPTLQMWCASWNTIIPGEKDENGFIKIEPAANLDNSGYKYKVKNSTTEFTLLSFEGLNSALNDTKRALLNEEKYKVFFSHTEEFNKCRNYWLASPGASGSNSLCVVTAGYLGQYDYNDSRYNGWGFRPVVCLNENVKLTFDEEKEVYTLSFKK